MPRTNCAASFLCVTTDSTSKQDVEAEAHQQGEKRDVCTSQRGASLLEV